MTKVELSNHKFAKDRTALRKEIIKIFLEEQPGTGKGEYTSKYIYTTKIVGENEIFLSRPAQFNNGFDFTVNVSGIDFNIGYINKKGKKKKSTTRPSHEHILNDLLSKKKEDLSKYKSLVNEVDKIYSCQEYNARGLNFSSGYDSEIILECIKWLLIEQDVTYWNYSGRFMFYQNIKQI